MLEAIHTDFFLVRGPAIGLLPSAQLRTTGVTMTTVNGESINSGLDEMITVCVSVYRIAEVLTSGFQVSVIAESDVVKIHDVCLAYITREDELTSNRSFNRAHPTEVENIRYLMTQLQRKHKSLLTKDSNRHSFFKNKIRLFGDYGR